MSASGSEDPRTVAFGTAPSATRRSSAADESVETETRGDDDADPEAADVAEEVDALVSAACARGIGAAAQTLREAMAMASGKNVPGAACCDRHAARAMAEATAAALVKQILPGLAEASRARLLDAETRVRPGSRLDFRLDFEEDLLVDLSAPEATANPRAALLAAQLLDAMPPDDEDEDDEAFDGSASETRVSRRGPRERVLLALRLAFRARLGNCLEASRAGAFPPLARFLLSAARDAETNSRMGKQSRRTKIVARLAQTCVAHVVAQTVLPAHLRSYLAMARGASGFARGALVAALAEALEHTKSLGPAATFQLDGEGSGLLGAVGGGDGSVGSNARTKSFKTDDGAANGTSDEASDAHMTGGGASFFRRLATAVAFGGNSLHGDPDPRPKASLLTRAAFGANAFSSGPTRSEWPFKRGFAVCTWLYVESFRASPAAEDAAAATAAMASICAASSRGSDAHRASPAAAAAAAAAAVGGDKQEHMPRLFSFLSTEASDKNFGAQGVEAYFHGSYLVVEATGADGARCAMPFTTPFSLKKWICVAVEYDPPADEKSRRDDATSSNKTSKTSPHGEVRLYLDGAVAESHRFRVPPVSGPLGFCCVGTNPPAAMAGMQRRRRQCALFASLGPVYVFREAVGVSAMAELARRGGTYAPDYTTRDGSPEDGVDAANARLDASLAPKLLQVLHPATAVAGDGDAAGTKPVAVPDLSPLGAGGTRSDRRGSLLGSGSKAVARVPIRDALERASPLGAAALLSLMCAEKDNKDDDSLTLASSLEPTLRSIASCLAGDASTRKSAVAALEAASFASLLHRALPRALRALRDVRRDADAVSYHEEYSGTENESEHIERRLDAEEASAVEAVEVLVAERAPSQSALRKSLCASFFASLDAWTGGADDEVRTLEDASKQGVGQFALLRVLRVTHAMAHAEGGAALREAGGATRLLEAAVTRVLFPVCVFFPAKTPGCAGAPGGAPGGEPGGAFPNSGRATVPSSLRAGVEGAPPGPPCMENASFGVRAPLMKDSVESATSPSPPSAAKKASLADARGVLLDALVPPVSALLRSDANAQEALSAVVAFAGDCEDPRVAARALAAALEVAESPGATGASARRAFVRAGGADACAGMLRALALRYEGKHDVVTEGDEQKNDARVGAGELAATCARVLLALARGGELASAIRGDSTSFATRGTSFLDAALAERATRHAFRLAPKTLLTTEAWSACLSAPEDGALGAALEALQNASAATRRRALDDARALFLSDDVSTATRLASVPEWPTWLVACVVRESADAADASADATQRDAARAAAKVGLDALDAALRRACHKAGGWRRVESAARAFGEHFHHAKAVRDVESGESVESGDALDARLARAAKRALERALGAHAAFAASALRAAKPDPEDAAPVVGAWTSAADAETARARIRRESVSSRVSSLGSDAEFSFSNKSASSFFSTTDGVTNGVAASKAEASSSSRATLLTHARATLFVIDSTLEEPSVSERTSSSSSSSSSSSEKEEEEEEEEEDAHDARLCLLRSARTLVDALLASSESSNTTPLPSAVAAAALRVALRSLRAATRNPTMTNSGTSSDSDSDAEKSTEKQTSVRAFTDHPLVSAACAEAAAAADGVGAGGVSAADALGYAFVGQKTPDKKDAEASEHSRCLATTHRVLAPYLQGGRSRHDSRRGASAPHFAVAALFSELKRNEEEAGFRANDKRKSRRGTRFPNAEKTSFFLCAHLLCLIGRWRSAVAEACADKESYEDAHSVSASASAASELLGTAEPTRAMLLRPSLEAVLATLAPPWSDALAPSTKLVGSLSEILRSSDAVFLSADRSDGDDAFATEASRSARANAERAAADARERAFNAFDVLWRRLGAPAKETREGDEGDGSCGVEGDPGDPLSPFANLSAKMKHVASRWRELLERAASAREDARNESVESARRGEEAWRLFAARCAEAGLGDVAW